MANNNRVNSRINKVEIRINTLNLNLNFGPNQPDTLPHQIAEAKAKPVPTHYYREHDCRVNQESNKLRNALTTAQSGIKATNEINKSLRQGLNDTSAKVLEQKEVIERQKKVIASLEEENKREKDKKQKRQEDLKAAIELAKSYRDMAVELEKKFEKLESTMDKLFR